MRDAYIKTVEETAESQSTYSISYKYQKRAQPCVPDYSDPRFLVSAKTISKIYDNGRKVGISKIITWEVFTMADTAVIEALRLDIKDFRESLENKVDKLDIRVRTVETDVAIIKNSTDNKTKIKDKLHDRIFNGIMTFISIVVVGLAIFLIDRYC